MAAKKDIDEKVVEEEVEEYLRHQGWKALLRDPRIWAIIVLSAAMSTSIFTLIERYTGLELNPSADKMSNSCVYRALYEGDFEDKERLTAAKVCVPKHDQ